MDHRKNIWIYFNILVQLNAFLVETRCRKIEVVMIWAHINVLTNKLKINGHWAQRSEYIPNISQLNKNVSAKKSNWFFFHFRLPTTIDPVHCLLFISIIFNIYCFISIYNLQFIASEWFWTHHLTCLFRAHAHNAASIFLWTFCIHMKWLSLKTCGCHDDAEFSRYNRNITNKQFVPSDERETNRIKIEI